MIKLGTKHIRVFSSYSEYGSAGPDGSLVLEAPKNQMDVFLDRLFAGVIGPDEARKLLKEAAFLNSGAKKTILFLIESGQFDLSTKASALGQEVKNFFKKGKTSGISERLEAMKLAIKSSQGSGEMHFVFKSSNGWKSEGINSYKSKLNGKEGINYLNKGLFFDIMKSGSPVEYFGKDTTELIAVYLEARGWKSNLMQGMGTFENIDLKDKIPYLQNFAIQKWENEKKKVNPIFEGISRNFPNNPEIKKAIETLGADFGVPLKNGVFDVIEYKRQFLLKNEGSDDSVVMEAMKKDLTLFNEKSKGLQGKINQEKNAYEQKLGNKKSLSKFPELQGIDFSVLENGKNISVKDISITNLKGKYAIQILAQIGEKYKEKVPNELVNLILLLGLQNKEETIIVGRASATESLRSANKGIQPNQEVVNSAGEIARSRHHIKNAEKATGNISNSEVQKQLQILLKKEQEGIISEDEIGKLANLKQRKTSTGELAQQYSLAKVKFGEAEAQRIFTQSNQVVSDNPKETYNFQSLEKIAILTDPESTPGQKSLARLEAGQSLPMSQALQGELQISIMNAPELQNINISKNPDGTYNIPTFNATRITKKQVEEYKKNTSMYAELGLSQFIPHIPLISAELRAKGINTVMDGQTGTMEQQQVLKALYSQLFGKEIISSNLSDVERAFSSALGNPTNMKNAMQHTLKIYQLIPDSGRAISADILTAWIRKNNTDNRVPDPSKNLT